jgi:hypothetical protein
LKLQNIQAKPQDPRDLLVALSAPGSVGTQPTNISIFFVVFQRDLSRISLRYDTVPVYGSISNESYRFNQITACPGSVSGENYISFHAAIRGDRGEEEEGNKRGHKFTVGEAFAGRRDTKPQELEDGTTSFEMGYNSVTITLESRQFIRHMREHLPVA